MCNVQSNGGGMNSLLGTQTLGGNPQAATTNLNNNAQAEAKAGNDLAVATLGSQLNANNGIAPLTGNLQKDLSNILSELKSLLSKLQGALQGNQLANSNAGINAGQQAGANFANTGTNSPFGLTSNVEQYNGPLRQVMIGLQKLMQSKGGQSNFGAPNQANQASSNGGVQSNDLQQLIQLLNQLLQMLNRQNSQSNQQQGGQQNNHFAPLMNQLSDAIQGLQQSLGSGNFAGGANALVGGNGASAATNINGNNNQVANLALNGGGGQASSGQNLSGSNQFSNVANAGSGNASSSSGAKAQTGSTSPAAPASNSGANAGVGGNGASAATNINGNNNTVINIAINLGNGRGEDCVAPVNGGQQASISGANSITEGQSGSYSVKLTQPVQQDTWVDVKVNNGTATRTDAKPVVTKEQAGGLLPMVNKPVDGLAYWSDGGEASAQGGKSWRAAAHEATAPLVGGGAASGQDFTIFDGDGKAVAGDTVRVLVKAGQSESSKFSVKAWQEVALGFGTDGTESDEKFSMNILNGSANKFDVTIKNNDRTSASPVALDLNGDQQIGVTGQTTARDGLRSSLGKTVSFDIDADGSQDNIEWMNGDGDGLLVDNSDGNAAQSMDGARLFGDQGGKYSDGYAKLSQRDGDGDGNLTGEELDGLNVWVDNGDAQVQDGELKSLADLGVTSISAKRNDVQNAKGETLMQSKATMNGNDILTEDVWFGKK